MVKKMEDKPDKPLKLQEKLRKDIGEGIIKSMTGFVDAFSKRTDKLNNDLAMNLNKQRLDLRKVFKNKIDDVDLLPNLLEFKDYLEQSGESIANFGKNAKLTDQQIKSLEKSISTLDKTTREMDVKERNLRKAGLVTEREISNGKLRLKVLTASEVRKKQQEIINKRKQIDDEEKNLIKLAKQKDEQGRISEETQKEIEKTTKLIEDLNQEIQNTKNTGVKEVQKVLGGFAGAVADTYSKFKTRTDDILDSFLPGPVAQVFKSMIQAVETLVGQVVDLFKPITATIGLILKAPRLIAKNFFGKTDEEFDEMRKNFIEKTKKFLLESATMAKDKVKDAAMYIGGKFLRAVRFVGKVFTGIGLAVKGIMLALMPFKLTILAIVGILALVGVAIFMFGKKIYEVGAKIGGYIKGIFEKIGDALKPIIDPIVKAFTAIKDTIMSIVNFFREKLDFLKPTERQEERKRELQEFNERHRKAKSGKDRKRKYTDEQIRAMQESGEFGQTNLGFSDAFTDEDTLKKGLIDDIMKERPDMNRGELEKMSTRQLVNTARPIMQKSNPFGDMNVDEFKKNLAIARSGEEEKQFLKNSKILVDGEEKDMHSILYDNTEKGLRLKGRLQNNQQFKDYMKTKAEFDARQKEIGGMTSQQSINNLTSSQSVTAVSKLPTRNAYAPYTDANAMSYG